MKQITQQDLEGKGNIGMPDTPELTTQEMQAKLDELSRDVIIPVLNQNSQEFDGYKLANDNYIETLDDEIQTHKSQQNNPHLVTALQTGAYTKQETDQKIQEKVVEISSADMTKQEYAGSGTGVVKKADIATAAEYAESADKLDGLHAVAFATAAQGTKADKAMPITGGSFAGDASAVSDNRTTSCIRNIEVRITSPTGELQPTNSIIMVRK